MPMEAAVFDDLLRDGLQLVVCGTAAGAKSAKLKHYYAGPGNKFWRTLAELSLTPRQLAPSEADLLLDFGIGLTDLVKGQSGPESLREKVLMLQPRVLCFNGKRAAREFLGTKAVAFGAQRERIGVTVLYVAPSDQGAGVVTSASTGERLTCAATPTLGLLRRFGRCRAQLWRESTPIGNLVHDRTNRS